jgi:N-acetylglucosamine transport system substrate-binding protein
MLSVRGARDFTQKVSSLTVVAGTAEGLSLGSGLDSCVRALKASGDKGFNWIYPVYYRKLERNLVDAACGEFFSGRIGPDAFLAQCQKGADEIAKDTSFKKYKRQA